MGRQAHSFPRSCLWLGLTAFVGQFALAEVVPFQDLGFLFDYNNPSDPIPIPITQQCERLHITWGRRDATGPNPAAPYYFMVYTSTSSSPFKVDAGNGLSFDWDVPFSPGTQYQICMYDKNGVSGGCQDHYTVVKNTTVTKPTCQNVTSPTMDVIASVNTGNMSDHGFIPQCTDLSVKPLQGSPPFTLTIAPSLHPPYKIVSNSMDAINWTVSLSRSFPFFLSLTSSEGMMWASGPQHSGAGSDDCLTLGAIPQKRARALATSAGVGGTFGGLIFGVLVTAFIFWYRQRHAAAHVRLHSRPASVVADGQLPTYPSPAATEATSNRPLLSLLGRLQTRQTAIQPYTGASSSFSPQPSDVGTTVVPNALTRNNTAPTYVYHQDALPEVSAQDVIDLPPEYIDRRSSGSSSSGAGSPSSAVPSSGVLSSSSPVRTNSTNPRPRKS
ncbi:hypothetical protein HGRIS_001752 [Hohenbuehelia grisea]|uniref:Fibronectin type-III domain-containing protein n=1 Tax=Hohenbuehelia grisea TaxID=104357 RepID=A0ABR3JIE1_9AGAR